MFPTTRRRGTSRPTLLPCAPVTVRPYARPTFTEPNSAAGQWNTTVAQRRRRGRVAFTDDHHDTPRSSHRRGGPGWCPLTFPSCAGQRRRRRLPLLRHHNQFVRGADALRAGLLLAPQGIGALLSRPLAGGLSDKIGARWVAFTGFAIVGLATVPFALASSTTNQWLLMAALLVRGFGLAAVTIPLSAAGFIGLRRDEIPHAGIITRIAQQVGGSFGAAVLAVILDAALRNLDTHPRTAAHAAAAFNQAFWWAVGFTAAALVLSLMLPGRT